MEAAANHCHTCPRVCNVARNAGTTGYCRTGSQPAVAAVCLHHGEEPVLDEGKGICNVFFSGCNLRCVYCQNHLISHRTDLVRFRDLPSVLAAIDACLLQGADTVGLVTPSHQPAAAAAIARALKNRPHPPRIVYNSAAYELPRAIAALEPLVDVYLPDFKYGDSTVAARYSSALDYPAVALRALREMLRQKGSNLVRDQQGKLISGLIVRHLVLPGHVDNSIRALRLLAEELPTTLHVSLMAQYWPSPALNLPPPLNRRITAEEYALVRDEFFRLGFHHGWLQAAEAAVEHLPDFRATDPFVAAKMSPDAGV